MENAESLATCRRCDWPLVGNESYCSNCGKRLEAGVSLRAILGILVLFLVIAGTGTCIIRSRHPAPGTALTSSPR